MNISAISMSIPSGIADSSMSLALLSKVLDTAEATGEQLTEMMQSAAPVVRGMGLGDFIDVRA